MHERMHGRMGPIGTFVRARLRRRIFAWFLGGILTTGLVVFLLMVLVARIQEPEWTRTWEGSRGWVGKQFAREWVDPMARQKFAVDTAKELDANIDLIDSSGQRFFSTGDVCRHAALEAPVRDATTGAALGSVIFCPARSHAPWKPFVFLGIFLSAVWMVSGRVARRLARPLDELTEVVKRIGQGDLKARTDLTCYEPDEIGVVADAVNDMAARIEKQVEDQRELLATVSHELRTPLARMRVISEIGRDSGATEKTFDELDREVIEMDSLVGELLASSRLEFGQVAKRELSVRDLSARAVERAGLSATTLAVNGEADSLTGDPTLLQRALANLFDNARKHANGADGFEVNVDAERVKFEVLDRGPGVNGNASSLFEKFNKGQNGNGADGLGLGLALVKRIAVAHGGEVWAGPRDGGGSRFGFSVKRA
ncbi:MAG: HAMP domain-containing histidine kinase [Archangium sp.]|nr:HAMP domain-containing histidine kinase [Archangium sp.]